jgi:hypothetical protein
VVEAEQFFPDRMPWPAGVLGREAMVGGLAPGDPDPTWTYYIDTLEGPHIVTPGDWIITGVKGEKYPCKPDIFEATYEPADSTPPRAPSTGEVDRLGRTLAAAHLTRDERLALMDLIAECRRLRAQRDAALDCVRAEARDCGCASRIEARIRGELTHGE